MANREDTQVASAEGKKAAKERKQAAAKKKGEKLKERVRSAIKRYKEKTKTVGEPKIPGVEKPGRPKGTAVKEAKEKKRGGTQQVQTGPKGGQYKIAPTGKKYYLQSEKTRTFHRPMGKSEEAIKEVVDTLVRDERIKKVIEEFKKAKPHGASSLKPPKEWWNKMERKIRSANPDYSSEQVSRTIGDIWYNEMSSKKRSAKRKAEGKKYGKAPKSK